MCEGWLWCTRKENILCSDENKIYITGETAASDATSSVRRSSSYMLETAALFFHYISFLILVGDTPIAGLRCGVCLV